MELYPLDFSYTITLLVNKKISMLKDTGLQRAVDSSGMTCGHLGNGNLTLRSISSEYPRFIEENKTKQDQGT